MKAVCSACVVLAAMAMVGGCAAYKGTKPPGLIVTTGQGVPCDPVNVVVVGTRQELQAAFKAAKWSEPDQLNIPSGFGMFVSVMMFIPYPKAPMGNLFLWNRRQDIAFQRTDWTARTRHHVRFWRADFASSTGRPVWFGASIRDNGVTVDGNCLLPHHGIDPDVDAERARLADDLQKSGKVALTRTLAGGGPIAHGLNALNDSYHSDGKVVLFFLAPAAAGPPAPAMIGPTLTASDFAPSDADQLVERIDRLYRIDHAGGHGVAGTIIEPDAGVLPSAAGEHQGRVVADTCAIRSQLTV